MSERTKRNRNNKEGRLPPFVAVTWKMINSEAFKDLSHSASKILLHFLGKPKTNQAYPVFYEKEFEFTYREANRHGFAHKTFARVIRELVEKGFVDPVRKGGLRGDGKSSNIFKNSLRWQRYGENDFKQIRWERFVH